MTQIHFKSYNAVRLKKYEKDDQDNLEEQRETEKEAEDNI